MRAILSGRCIRYAFSSLLLLLVCGWTPIAVKDDPLVRMPGTQPQPENAVNLESPDRCLNCHADYNTSVEPGFNWQGSMMAQAGRDFLYWACLAVAAQDSIWAVGTPNATDICLRCHMGQGWVDGRSDPTNGTAMVGADFDGVQCDQCHRMFDPFFAETHSGLREGADWSDYWDETNLSGTTSQSSADLTFSEDFQVARGILQFNGLPFYGTDGDPVSSGYTENAGGQYFLSPNNDKRASFADAEARHQMLYSRYHKSKFFCATCHDVSNPVLANLPHSEVLPGDGQSALTTETESAHSYFHVERTFSEFMLSAYGVQGGAPGIGPFAPGEFNTSLPDNAVGRCQDCHMRDVLGAGCDKRGAPVRPGESVEHPQSGQPLHDLTGGNVWVSHILASTVVGSPNYDPQNASLLNQGPNALVLDLTQGLGIDPVALLAGKERASQQLQMAAAIEELSYDPQTGSLHFRVQNQTGHKLISGFPEGRRMFVNVKAHTGGSLVYQINPYDDTVGTLKGLPTDYSPSSPPLGPMERYVDELVYEMHPTSALTGEIETFHFALATGRYKDNRIPPKGFRIAEAAGRHAEPVWHGEVAPDYFSPEEYAGGYDDVDLTIVAGAERVEVGLYYQVTSREYIEFLRDEIQGTGRRTLFSPTPSGEANAYIIQTDQFFANLSAWGETIWQLWQHNMDVPGAAPLLMAVASTGAAPDCTATVPTLLGAVAGHSEVILTWSDEHSANPDIIGYSVYYDQAGKSQLLAAVGKVTGYADSGLTNGQQYCYKVTSRTALCESAPSNVAYAIPKETGLDLPAGFARLETGKTTTTGKGNKQVTTFAVTDTFGQGDEVTVRAYAVDLASDAPLEGASVNLVITDSTGAIAASFSGLPTDADGIVQAAWKTQAPNRKGNGGTPTGNYNASATGMGKSGYQWDGTVVTATFTVNGK